MLKKNKRFVSDTGMENAFALGRQLTIEYCECGPDMLLDKNNVEKAMLKAAADSGATIINSTFHDFSPQGLSGVVLIAESHFTIHAWPEHNYAAVDIFTCADNIDLEVAINSMKTSFQASNVVISSDQNRGVISKPLQQEKIGEVIKNSEIRPIAWEKEFINSKPWGVLTSVDIYETDPELIRDADIIKTFVHKLCDLIEMKRYGECEVIHFGDDEKVAGFSMTQLIETSLISGHFANATNTAYLDIFSCKFYDPRQVAEFASRFFKGDHYKMQLTMRK